MSLCTTPEPLHSVIHRNGPLTNNSVVRQPRGAEGCGTGVSLSHAQTRTGTHHSFIHCEKSALMSSHPVYCYSSMGLEGVINIHNNMYCVQSRWAACCVRCFVTFKHVILVITRFSFLLHRLMDLN